MYLRFSHNHKTEELATKDHKGNKEEEEDGFKISLCSL
jgi:hypothetical protein